MHISPCHIGYLNFSLPPCMLVFFFPTQKSFSYPVNVKKTHKKTLQVHNTGNFQLNFHELCQFLFSYSEFWPSRTTGLQRCQKPDQFWRFHGEAVTKTKKFLKKTQKGVSPSLNFLTLDQSSIVMHIVQRQRFKLSTIFKNCEQRRTEESK